MFTSLAQVLQLYLGQPTGGVLAEAIGTDVVRLKVDKQAKTPSRYPPVAGYAFGRAKRRSGPARDTGRGSSGNWSFTSCCNPD